MPKKLNPSFASFKYFEALFQNTKQNTVILMNDKGIITEINTAFTDAFGYQDKDIIGKHTRILFTEEDQKKGLPEKELNNVKQSGESKDNNYLVHKSGLITWVSGESILVKNEKGEVSILKVIQDIHAQKATEHSLRAMNEFNESILGTIEDVVIVLSSDFKIIKTNTAFPKLFPTQPGVDMLDFADGYIMKPFALTELLEEIQLLIKMPE